ncbi:hypothetical protein OC842_001328 [Tilletia horrida]|uniref:Uncharacterized protein n=1 Tax=Tilletia horrida TaxID=155126 RepID=A0AAN6GFV6_9BASI|nr:hypothetical protein OC842_001328 [Tilletia horrida]
MSFSPDHSGARGTGRGPGPGPGPGPGGGIALAAAAAILTALATRAALGAAAARGRAIPPISNTSSTSARKIAVSTTTHSLIPAQRPASAAARTAILNHHHHHHASSTTTTTNPLTKGEWSISNITASIKKAAAAAIRTPTRKKHAAFQQIPPPHPLTFHPRPPVHTSSPDPFHTVRIKLAHSHSHNTHLTSHKPIHGPGLHLARNFSTGAGSGSGAFDGASRAVQDHVPLLFRMLFDDEQKKKRMQTGANHRSAYAVAVPAAGAGAGAGAGAARPRRASKARRQRRNTGVRQCRQVRTTLQQPQQQQQQAVCPTAAPPLSTATVENEEQVEVVDSQSLTPAEQDDIYFTKAHVDEAQQRLRDRIGAIRTQLLHGGGDDNPPPDPHIHTVLRIHNDPVNLDHVRVLLPPAVPAHATASTSMLQQQQQQQQQQLDATMTIIIMDLHATQTGGFLADLQQDSPFVTNRLAAAAQCGHALTMPRHEQHPHDYDRPIRTFLRVRTALLSALQLSSQAEGQDRPPLSRTVRRHLGHQLSFTELSLPGLHKADVLQLLGEMLALWEQLPHEREGEGEGEGDQPKPGLSAAEIESALEPMLQEVVTLHQHHSGTRDAPAPAPADADADAEEELELEREMGAIVFRPTIGPTYFGPTTTTIDPDEHSVRTVDSPAAQGLVMPLAPTEELGEQLDDDDDNMATRSDSNPDSDSGSDSSGSSWSFASAPTSLRGLGLQVGSLERDTPWTDLDLDLDVDVEMEMEMDEQDEAEVDSLLGLSSPPATVLAGRSPRE